MLNNDNDDWLSGLNDEDRAFTKRFVLASGSLKDLAKTYGISYPTVRIRLNRLIDKIRVFDNSTEQSAFERTARGMFADGIIDAGSLKTLLAAHQAELKSNHDDHDN